MQHCLKNISLKYWATLNCAVKSLPFNVLAHRTRLFLPCALDEVIFRCIDLNLIWFHYLEM